MKYRPCGKHRFDCSAVGFGAWAIGGAWGAQADGGK
jgi:aryl-alcohol dehydrogenase-like predicted oxidoreductase